MRKKSSTCPGLNLRSEADLSRFIESSPAELTCSLSYVSPRHVSSRASRRKSLYGPVGPGTFSLDIISNRLLSGQRATDVLLCFPQKSLDEKANSHLRHPRPTYLSAPVLGCFLGRDYSDSSSLSGLNLPS